jgi:hypothetical protein
MKQWGVATKTVVKSKCVKQTDTNNCGIHY